jgi:hypothetical protein
VHLRTVKAKSGSTTKTYAQLVESYRRPDGMPVHRVVASLGQLSELEIANLRAALEASRKGSALLLPASARPRVQANLDYLALALALSHWQQWQLSQLFSELVQDSAASAPVETVLCALTLQRCLAPDSKLAATEWFPQTALPELLDCKPAHFNNTRVHRCLDELDRVDDQLQAGLVRRYLHRDGAFAMLFGDLTDAWFEGRGPDLAVRGRTKSGLSNRRKINILLVCNQHGFPVRWQVLPGNCADPIALSSLATELAQRPWASAVPIVFDRAMGHHSAVARMSQLGLHFLTAVRSSEIDGYDVDLGHAALTQLQGDEDLDKHPGLRQQAAALVCAAGMSKVDDELYVRELGLRSRKMSLPIATDNAPSEEPDPAQLEGVAARLAQARRYRAQLDARLFPNQRSLAAHLDISPARLSQLLSLLRLDEELQQGVLDGAFGALNETRLREIATLDKAAQRRALAALATTTLPRRRSKAELEVELRLVAYFNPRMFVDQRTTALRHERELRDCVADLNARLAAATKARRTEAIFAELDAELGKRSLRSVFRIEITAAAGSEPSRAALLRDDDAWNHRRRFDGFVLLVAHPDVGGTAADIAVRYRAKDAVEKDFQTIKSELELRPVFHHSDAKVRAHVSLCMLALLLERSLEQQLKAAGHPMTASACFDELKPVHLNRIKTSADAQPAYVLTDATPQQRTILRKLGATELLDELLLAERLVPRDSE